MPVFLEAMPPDQIEQQTDNSGPIQSLISTTSTRVFCNLLIPGTLPLFRMNTYEKYPVGRVQAAQKSGISTRRNAAPGNAASEQRSELSGTGQSGKGLGVVD
jgi:hypothetical protein